MRVRISGCVSALTGVSPLSSESFSLYQAFRGKQRVQTSSPPPLSKKKREKLIKFGLKIPPFSFGQKRDALEVHGHADDRHGQGAAGPCADCRVRQGEHVLQLLLLGLGCVYAVFFCDIHCNFLALHTRGREKTDTAESLMCFLSPFLTALCKFSKKQLEMSSRVEKKEL